MTKHFVAAGGMVVDESVRLVISAAAARLTMNLHGEHYSKLSEVVVYPTHYVHSEREGIVFGEANAWGTVVLSYEAVVHGMNNTGDGHNTALHEFAHVLDFADGQFDGTPVLRELAAYAPWTKVMSREFLSLRGAKSERRRNVLRRYGATNEAEFFAVATESFFEKPRKMAEKHPELYQVMKEYYQIDPALDE